MKNAKIFLAASATIVGIGGVLAHKVHRGVTGDLLVCTNGRCAASPYSSTNVLGGVQESPPVQMYHGTVGVICGQPGCIATNLAIVWFHPCD